MILKGPSPGCIAIFTCLFSSWRGVSRCPSAVLQQPVQWSSAAVQQERRGGAAGSRQQLLSESK